METNLVIKNAKMPEHCWACDYTYEDAHGATRCIFTREPLYPMRLKMVREDDCPLEEVTQPEKLEATTVLDRRTGFDRQMTFGNFVTCNNCGKTMLVDIDKDICPECEEDALDFVDTEQHQANDAFFAASAEYVLCDIE